MILLKWLRKTNIIPETRKLAFYPPFLFMGAKIIEASPDYRKLRVHLPLRWYGRNHYGTMFGGFMASLADPLPAILCQKIFPGVEVWTKKMSIDFIRPGRTDLELQITITDEHMRTITDDLSRSGRSRPTFHCKYVDKTGETVALVENTVSLRKKSSTPLLHDMKRMSRALRRIAPLQTAKTKSISEEFGASELLALIMEDFYGRQASDAILCHFFMEKDHLEIARKQTAFLLKMLGFTKSTRSKSPADAHKNLAQILPGHFTRRAQILKETLKDWGFDEDELQSWLHFEHSFEEQIKKGQAE